MENSLSFLQSGWHWILIALLVIVILIKFFPRYKIAPPDTALIISGLIRRNYKVRNSDGTIAAKKFGYRIVRGGATFYIPAIERIDQLDMSLNQVDIKTAQPVPTKEYISVLARTTCPSPPRQSNCCSITPIRSKPWPRMSSKAICVKSSAR